MRAAHIEWNRRTQWQRRLADRKGSRGERHSERKLRSHTFAAKTAHTFSEGSKMKRSFAVIEQGGFGHAPEFGDAKRCASNPVGVLAAEIPCIA